MDLKHIKTLFNAGKYQEIIEYLAPFTDQVLKASFNANDCLECTIFKICALERLDQNEDALKISSKLISQNFSHINKNLQLGIIVAHLYSLYKMKYTEDAIKTISEGDVILNSFSKAEKVEGAYWISQYLNLKAMVTGSISRNYKTLELYLEGLKFAEKDGSPDLIATLLNNIGHFYVEIGEINKAIEYFKRGLDIDELAGNPIRTNFLFGNLGRLYRLIGKLKLSNEYFSRCLTSAKLSGNQYMIAEALFQIFLTALEQKDESQEYLYLTLLQNLFDQTQNKNIGTISHFAQALFLKKNIRASKKFQALDILANIVNHEPIDNEYKTLAISHLCELLLVEYRSFGEPEVLQEIKRLILEFEEMAQSSQSFIFKVETLMLKARFALVEGNFQQALKYMDQASMVTEEKGYKLLMKRILREKAQFEADYEKTVNLVQRTSSLHKHLEITQIEGYLKEVRNAVHLLKKTS